jgi:hypothetical protein
MHLPAPIGIGFNAKIEDMDAAVYNALKLARKR